MERARAEQCTSSGKTLSIFCSVFHEGAIPDAVIHDAKDAFQKLAPFIHNDNQVLYLRDIPFLAIKGKYPSGHCFNPYEAMIALASWQDDAQQIKAAINHELHHMARWQNPGYGETLGGAILSEGIATYYENLQSGWRAPWAETAFTNDALEDAVENWGNNVYDHNAWFFEGPHGEWVGYGIGLRLAGALFKDGFDLERSIMIEPDEALEYAKRLRVQ